MGKHGYFTREYWWCQQWAAGNRGYPCTDWDRCHNPLGTVRAADWLRELDA